MAQLTINIGSAPNDGSGDPLRTAFDKCNQNFTDLYTNGGGGGGGSGTVTSVSVVSANGVSASVSNPTTTPAMTFSLGAITPSSVNGVALSGSSTPSLAVTGASSISGSHSGSSSNTNTGDVSLASPNRYLSLTGQQITPALVDLASHVTGDLPLSNLVQASSENVLLGRGVGAGSGDFQQITIGSGLSMSGTTLTSTASGGAPTNAEYLVGAVNGTLTNERLVGNSTSITANLATSGAATFERAALTGDVTAAANSNATTIAAGVVNTAKLGGDITTAGKALLDDVDAAAQRTTLGLGTLATQNGTFSGTSSGTNTGDVTLASPSRYLSLAGQQITPALVDLTAHVTGDLPLSNLAQASAEQVLLGRGVGAGAGDFQQITLGTNLSMSGTTLNATGGAGGGNVSGPASPTTDNALTRWDGTSGQLIQNSGVTLSDTQEMAGLKSVAFNTAGGTTALATLTWDTTNQTLDLGIGAGSVNALLGVDSHVLGRNTTGSAISRGQVVRVNGASAGNLTIALAQGNTDPNTANTIGIAAENIANNATGMVITSGLLRDLNTSTFSAGDLLYISPTTAGLLVNTIPAAPNHAVRMGYVVSSHPSNGIIYVAVNNGYELNELHDVNYPTTPATNDFLVYVTNRWENQTAATARTSMGLGTLATQNGTFSGTSSGTNTGDQTITLTGDVTGSGTGSFAATIQPNAVTTAKIANSNVTLAKIENTTGLSVLGNAGTVAAAPANITGTAGQVLRVNNGGTALAFGAVDLSTAGAITGTLGVSNGGTGVTTSTGSGSTVLSDAPTFTGQVTVAAGTATAPAITPTGDSNTGVWFSAADQITLVTGGQPRLSVSDVGQLLINRTGSIGVPSLASSSDGNTGFYFPAADNFGLVTGGVERVRVDSAGRVGIGTASPVSFNASATPSLAIVGASSSVGIGNLNVWSNDTGGAADLGGNIALGGDDGVTAARTYAEIRGRKENATSGDYASYLSFGTRANLGSITERMRINSAGQVAIGNTTNAATIGGSLCITTANSVNGQIALFSTNSGTIDTGGSILFGGHDGVSATRGLAYIAGRKENATSGDYASYLTFQTRANGGSVTERMRITSGGSVLVNTAAVATTATDGFLYIPSCAGVPTGTPTIQTGRNPLVIDSTNSKLYFYNGSWVQAGGGGGGGTSITNVWLPAAQWIPRTTNGCGINSLESTTNKINYDVLEFDQATIEYAQVAVVMPSNWNAGTVTAKIHWTAGTATGTPPAVVWAISGRAYPDASVIDSATGTAVSVTDTLSGANELNITSATGAMTLAGTPAAGQLVVFQLYRDASNVSDTLTADARLVGVEITYTSV